MPTVRQISRLLLGVCVSSLLVACATPKSSSHKANKAPKPAKVAGGGGSKMHYGLYDKSRDIDRDFLERGQKERGFSLGSL